MKITVLFPTQTEASLFQRDDVSTIISGVGLSATAHATTKLICQQKPDLLIMAGIAGAYPHSGLKIGDVTLITTEVEGDLGFFNPSGFVHLAHLPIDMEFERRHTLACPHIPANPLFPLARSMSLNAAMAPFVDTGEVDLENMEGAAFFHVCLQENQAFLELRAISNFVNIHNDEWDMQGSVKAMTAGLHRLIDSLLQSTQ
ncbi:purine phosphorylase [Undibacterium sp. CY18W]|uniref:Purine phosphorylase n=1 Tax=Undibacterium hunanense TaxID=2762292 RepID=A0ABR6ZVG5_9BURK|nr:purine phosphorylase [Undibacterium hunanense]MBC3919867.1 purine phosphorylase [Undibacterium hunanense]